MKVLSKLDSLDNIQDGNTRKLITKTTSSGSGNAVTAVSVSGDTITYTKGSTFLTGHQNAFSNVKVGSSTVAADQAGDTLELVAGDNVTLTPDTTNDKVTIAATFATKLTGTQANPIYLTSLESGQYLIQGYIKIDATHDFAIPVNCPYDTNCIIGYELFTICKNINDGTMSVSCNYGNFLYDITGDNPVLLEEQMYASIDDIPTKTSDLTNDSNFVSISKLSGTESNPIIISSLNGGQYLIKGYIKLDSNTNFILEEGSAFDVQDIPNYILFEIKEDTVNHVKFVSCDYGHWIIEYTGSIWRIEQGSEFIDWDDLNYITDEVLPETYYSISNPNGYTSNTGTITKVQANGTDVASSGTANIPAASTSAYGVTKLSNATDSTSEVLAATPKAVKAAYDLAAGKGTGTITGVSVNGTSIATSGVANITSVPASILSGAIANGVTATTQSSGDNSTKVATTAYVDGAIAALPEPMLFKGSVGTGGTVTWANLATAAATNEGWTYKVITDHTAETGKPAAKVGDTIISTGSEWVVIPSGDEPSGTVTSVTIKATSPIAIDSESAITSSGTRTLSHANSGVTAGTYKSVTVNATGHVTAGTNPTTLSGYGITDANINNGVITLGSNTLTPIKATDYATTATAGIIKASDTYATSVGSSNGALYANQISYADFSDLSSNAFISKGTLNNVLTGRGYTTNTGTITGVSVNGTSVATSGVADITSVPASILTGAIPSAVTATTQTAGDNSTKIATTAYTDEAVSNRLEKSHSATNIIGTTLWSGNSLVSTVTNTQTANGNSTSLSDTGIFLGDNSKGKLKISNGTNNDSIELGRTYNNNWYGLEVDSSGVSITGLKTPTNNTDAANKQYVDNKIRSGTTTPSSDLGNDGDIYIKYSAS